MSEGGRGGRGRVKGRRSMAGWRWRSIAGVNEHGRVEECGRVEEYGRV